jgi:RimJ/RimL family protein N-acetyltransferase
MDLNIYTVFRHVRKLFPTSEEVSTEIKQLRTIETMQNNIGTVVLRDRTQKICTCSDITYIVKVDGEYAGRLCIKKLNWIFTEYVHLFIEEKFRGKGLAKLLNYKLFEIATTPFGFATVRADNIVSLTLLHGIGFVDIKEIKSPETGDQIITMYIDLLEWRNTNHPIVERV